MGFLKEGVAVNWGIFPILALAHKCDIDAQWRVSFTGLSSTVQLGERWGSRGREEDYDKDRVRRIPTKLGLDNWKAILVTGQGQINLIGGLGWKFNVDYGSFIMCPETQRQPRQYPGASLSWEENHLAQHVKRTPQYVAQTHKASQALELKATWGRSTT